MSEPAAPAQPIKDPSRTPKTIFKRKDQIKLWRFMEEIKNEIAEAGLSIQEVSTRAASALELPVKRSHIRNIANDMDIVWQVRPAARRKAVNKANRDRIRTLEKQMDRLRNALMAVVTKFGEEIPAYVRDKEFGGSWPMTEKEDEPAKV